MAQLMCDRLKKKLAAGEFCKGFHCSSSDLALYELAAISGIDYMWIDTEHAAVNMESVLHGMMIAQAHGVSAIVRVAQCDPVLAKPYLDNGADGIVFPMVNTAEEARLAVAACRYPLAGVRGFGPQRANAYGAVKAADQVSFGDKHVMPIIQIEHVDAVNNLDEILSVDGIDYAVIGPMDLSASVGKVGQMDDPEVSGMLDTIFAKCKEHNVKVGVSTGPNRALFDRCRAQGASFISMGNPYSFVKYGIEQWLFND